MAGTCEYAEEPSGLEVAGNFLTSCRTSELLKKDSAPWSKSIFSTNVPPILIINRIYETQNLLSL